MPLFDRRAKTAPSHYPRVLFHGIRAMQLISSLVVGGIMSYFMYQLTHDNWTTPWTFIWVREHVCTAASPQANEKHSSWRPPSPPSPPSSSR